MRLARPSPGQHAMGRRQQPCLEAAARAMAEAGDVPKEVSENQRCEDNSCSAARYSPPSSNLLREMVKGTEQSCYPQAEVLGTDRPYRGPLEFQRQRADIADGQTLTAGQYYYIIIRPQAALAGLLHSV